MPLWSIQRLGRLRGEGDKIKFINPRFERGQVAGFRKGRRRQEKSCQLHVLAMNYDLWDRVCLLS